MGWRPSLGWDGGAGGWGCGARDPRPRCRRKSRPLQLREPRAQSGRGYCRNPTHPGNTGLPLVPGAEGAVLRLAGGQFGGVGAGAEPRPLTAAPPSLQVHGPRALRPQGPPQLHQHLRQVPQGGRCECPGCPPVCPSICPSVCPPACSVCRSVCPWLHLRSVRPLVSLSVHLSVCPSVSFVKLCSCLPAWLSLRLPAHPFLLLSVRPSVRLSHHLPP